MPDKMRTTPVPIKLKPKVGTLARHYRWVLTLRLADIDALGRGINDLSDLMRHTGVGTLPLLSTHAGDSEQPPTEQQMISDTARAIQVLYEKLKRSQEGSAVVANLLNPAEPAARTLKG
jgi:hypothetical protein